MGRVRVRVMGYGLWVWGYGQNYSIYYDKIRQSRMQDEDTGKDVERETTVAPLVKNKPIIIYEIIDQSHLLGWLQLGASS
jgi:hypothetical protein